MICLDFISKISVEEIARHLHSEPSWDWVASCPALLSVCISVVALVAAIKTLKSQKQTEKNTTPIITLEIQEFLLREMIIRVFDGYMRLQALKHVLDGKNYTYYPSEEIIEDLKIDINDIHIDLFYNNHSFYRVMQGLMDLIKNYNIRLDVTNQHLKIKSIGSEYKRESIGRLMERNILIARTWKMVMALVFQYNNNKIQAVFNQVFTHAINEEENIIHPVIEESNFYVTFFDTAEGKKSFVEYMNAYIAHTMVWLEDRIIPVH